MTEQEAKELTLFRDWFKSADILDEDGNYIYAEQAWLARSKLNEKQSISSIPKDRRINWQELPKAVL